jgi:hypothetical protein
MTITNIKNTTMPINIYTSILYKLMNNMNYMNYKDPLCNLYKRILIITVLAFLMLIKEY